MDQPNHHEDPFEAALNRLRMYPEFQVLIDDLLERREEKFSELGGVTDTNTHHQMIGEMTVLHDLARVFSGD